MRLYLSIFLFSLSPNYCLYSQSIQYSPNNKLDLTVDQFYYDSEFIYLENVGKEPVDLEFEVVENTLLSEWNTSFCTNYGCYNKVQPEGKLGVLESGDQAYFLFNFGANETVGQGQVRIRISNTEQTDFNDTITFKYTVTEDGSIEAGPWVNINFEQGIFTVQLSQENIETQLSITSLEGKTIFDGNIGALTSIPLRDHPNGVYVYKVENSAGQLIKDKVLNFQ